MTFLSTSLLEEATVCISMCFTWGETTILSLRCVICTFKLLTWLTSSNYAGVDVRVHDLVHLRSADLVILGPTWTPGTGSTSICRCIEVGHVSHSCTYTRHSQADTHTHVHILTYTHMRTCTHTHTRTRAHTCTHTHTNMQCKMITTDLKCVWAAKLHEAIVLLCLKCETCEILKVIAAIASTIIII